MALLFVAWPTILSHVPFLSHGPPFCLMFLFCLMAHLFATWLTFLSHSPPFCIMSPFLSHGPPFLLHGPPFWLMAHLFVSWPTFLSHGPPFCLMAHLFVTRPTFLSHAHWASCLTFPSQASWFWLHGSSFLLCLTNKRLMPCLTSVVMSHNCPYVPNSTYDFASYLTLQLQFHQVKGCTCFMNLVYYIRLTSVHCESVFRIRIRIDPHSMGRQDLDTDPGGIKRAKMKKKSQLKDR
jgi:hypothetical protein